MVVLAVVAKAESPVGQVLVVLEIVAACRISLLPNPSLRTLVIVEV